MYRRLLHIILAIFLVGAVFAAEQKAKKKIDKNAKIKEKAAELVKGKEGRVGKLLALRKFVRDEVKQVKTQYGWGGRSEISPSRALENKSGDQQARAELLGELLKAVGQKPYFLTHGTGRDIYCIVLVSVTDREFENIKKETDANSFLIVIGKFKLAALPLEAKSAAGTVGEEYYDVEKKCWTASIALARYK